MARARKVHCVCGTPVMSATDHGLEFRCDCGATMFIPYEQLSGAEHRARFPRRASRREDGLQIPPPEFVGRTKWDGGPSEGRGSRRPCPEQPTRSEQLVRVSPNCHQHAATRRMRAATVSP